MSEVSGNASGVAKIIVGAGGDEMSKSSSSTAKAEWDKSVRDFTASCASKCNQAINVYFIFYDRYRNCVYYFNNWQLNPCQQKSKGCIDAIACNNYISSSNCKTNNRSRKNKRAFGGSYFYSRACVADGLPGLFSKDAVYEIHDNKKNRQWGRVWIIEKIDSWRSG